MWMAVQRRLEYLGKCQLILEQLHQRIGYALSAGLTLDMERRLNL